MPCDLSPSPILEEEDIVWESVVISCSLIQFLKIMVLLVGCLKVFDLVLELGLVELVSTIKLPKSS